jgi:hypothetical protein
MLHTRWLRAPLLAALCAAACAPAAPVPTSAQAARAGANLEELQEARTLYATRCSGCHRLPAPESRPPASWPGLVAKMSARSHIDADQARAIDRYLAAVASPP